MEAQPARTIPGDKSAESISTSATRGVKPVRVFHISRNQKGKKERLLLVFAFFRSQRRHSKMLWQSIRAA
jgi:hypothetical protein